MAFSRIFRTTIAGSAMIVLLASGAAHSTGSRYLQAPTDVSAAEAAFDDAPYGVDPVVTGPTSASFKKRQQAFNCDKAAWPNVPLACFPAH